MDNGRTVNGQRTDNGTGSSVLLTESAPVVICFQFFSKSVQNNVCPDWAVSPPPPPPAARWRGTRAASVPAGLGQVILKRRRPARRRVTGSRLWRVSARAYGGTST